jgi:ferritin-like metal-binding protein YciE
MGLFSSTKFTNLEDLFVEQIQDLYDAEHRLVDALPKMAKAATSPELRSAFQHHLAQTENHVKRLETVFQEIGKDSNRVSCEGIKGLIKEGEEVVEAKGDSNVKDTALVAAAQRVEHYEMAGYGCARSFAEWLGRDDVAQLLQQTLNEEGEADKTLTNIAQLNLNPQAARAAQG